MRTVAAAALASLTFVAAGCGGTTSQVARAGNLAGDAASLVPSDAKAFVAVDAKLDSQQWQRIDRLTKNFPAREKLIGKLLDGLDLQKDVAPALGPEVDFAALEEGEVVAFTKPDDESKLSALAAKLSKEGERYTVQKIGGWSVVADSQDAFARVRAAQGGQSLDQTDAFRSAWSAVAGEGVARAYATGHGVSWLAARVRADTDALRVDAVVQPSGSPPRLAAQSLLGDVPSGAALAVAFRGSGDLLQRLPQTMLPLKQFAPLLSGGGVLYVRVAGLIPDVALELAPKDPQAAIVAAHALLRSLAGKLGPLQLTAQLSGGKLVISDSPAAASALRGGAKLVDDAAFKTALDEAGVPAQTSFLAYADVSQLAPFIPILLQGITGQAPDPSLGENLAHVGPVVAWGTHDEGRVRLHLWLQPR